MRFVSFTIHLRLRSFVCFQRPISSSNLGYINVDLAEIQGFNSVCNGLRRVESISEKKEKTSDCQKSAFLIPLSQCKRPCHNYYYIYQTRWRNIKYSFNLHKHHFHTFIHNIKYSRLA